MTLMNECMAGAMPAGLPPESLVGATMLMEQHGGFHKAYGVSKLRTQTKAEIHVFTAGHGLVPSANRDGVFAPHGNVHSQSVRMPRMFGGVFA